MPRDLRTWIGELEGAGELLRVPRPVDPQTQMGALLYQSRERALLFESVAGHPGWKVLGQAPANLRHASLAFGTSLEGLIPTVAELMSHHLPPQLVATGPVKEVIQTGEQVNLLELPAHIAGDRDAGRFITAGLAVTKDPDTGRRNLSFHRLQVKGPRRSGMLLVPRHAYANYRKYEATGQPMPVAIFIGHHPCYYMAAATTGPYGLDEFEVAGGYLGEPVQLVRCETVDLEVPADAEIVLEGHVLPGVREQEGPFAEFHDYYVSGMGLNPVIEFQALTRRHDALYKTIQNGSEVEGCVFHKVPMSATIYRRLRSIGGYADIKNVLVLPGILGVAVQMTPRYYGEVRQVLLGAVSGEYLHPKIAIAVDEDVDLFSPGELWWVLATRVDPQRDITVIPDVRGHAMDPTAQEYGQPGQPTWQRLGSKLLIDATKPPTCDPSARAAFERVRPPGHGLVWLQDFLAPGEPSPHKGL